MASTVPNSSSIPRAASHCSIQILTMFFAITNPQMFLEILQDRLDFLFIDQIEG